jgi:hypothetical protein
MKGVFGKKANSEVPMIITINKESGEASGFASQMF